MSAAAKVCSCCEESSVGNVQGINCSSALTSEGVRCSQHGRLIQRILNTVEARMAQRANQPVNAQPRRYSAGIFGTLSLRLALILAIYVVYVIFKSLSRSVLGPILRSSTTLTLAFPLKRRLGDRHGLVSRIIVSLHGYGRSNNSLRRPLTGRRHHRVWGRQGCPVFGIVFICLALSSRRSD
jgi:hypothetical protein